MPETVTMPKLGFDMAEGTLIRWVAAEGESIRKGAILAEIETDKATVEVESNYEGVLARHLVSEGDVVPVNTPIAMIVAPGEEVPMDLPKEVLATPSKTVSDAEPAAMVEPVPPADLPDAGTLPGGVKASPLARRIAEEKGIQLKDVRGSGPGGRITKSDVEGVLAVPAGTAQPTLAPISPFSQSAPTGPMPPTLVPLSKLRSIIGRRMREAKQSIPHFYVTHEYDMAPVLALRKQVNQALPEEGKTSVNDYIVKAVALTLREFPNLNASLDERSNQIVRHGNINIGVAVAVEAGLLTVVCRDADRTPLQRLAVEVRQMVERARDGKVRPEDIEGSTFSVSNLGMYDVEHFIAIINPPEAAILAVGSALEVPVVEDGQIVPGIRMKVTISVDHRVSDGVEAARFLQAMAKYIEDPIRLLLA